MIKRIYLAGNPNVGKSVVFSRLTGVHVVSSNYPGTTVEISRGSLQYGDKDIEVVDLPGTPSKLLAFGLRWLPLSLLQPLLKRAEGSGRGDKMPSFHIDLYAGRARSEVEFLNGAVVRFGERYGVPTPVNQVLTRTLTAMAAGQMPRESFARQPKMLLQEILAADAVQKA